MSRLVIPLADRLARRTGPRTPTGCREWLGHLINSGYGLIRIGRANEGRLLAHRAAWQLVHGEVPEGLVVMHRCNNKRCVNVEHLKLGTQKENAANAVADGLYPRSQFSSEQIKSFAILHRNGYTMRQIAEKVGVSRPLISLLLNGKLKSSPFAKRTPSHLNGEELG